MLGHLDHEAGHAGAAAMICLQLGRQGGRGRDVERDVEFGGNERQAADRLADGEHLQLGAEPDPAASANQWSGVRAAWSGKRASASTPTGRPSESRWIGWIDHRDPVLLDHLGDPHDLLLLLLVLA